MQTEELLTELRTSQTDLARFVEAVVRDSMPYGVVPAEAVRAWQRRERQLRARGALPGPVRLVGHNGEGDHDE